MFSASGHVICSLNSGIIPKQEGLGLHTRRLSLMSTRAKLIYM